LERQAKALSGRPPGWFGSMAEPRKMMVCPTQKAAPVSGCVIVAVGGTFCTVKVALRSTTTVPAVTRMLTVWVPALRAGVRETG
jgi:hypothetical protein